MSLAKLGLVDLGDLPRREMDARALEHGGALSFEHAMMKADVAIPAEKLVLAIQRAWEPFLGERAEERARNAAGGLIGLAEAEDPFEEMMTVFLQTLLNARQPMYGAVKLSAGQISDAALAAIREVQAISGG